MDFSSNPILNLPPVSLFALLAWSVVWKGMSTWKAAQRQEKGWFIALIVINTFGILDIIYLQFFAKKSKKK